jgi:hypothetical protein
MWFTQISPIQKKERKKKLLEKRTQQKEHEGIPQDIRLVPSA